VSGARDTALALVCLDCYQVAGRMGTEGMGGEIDPSAEHWLAWAATAFPADTAFQAAIARKLTSKRAQDELLRAQR
jgi:hypothetical protein